MEQNQEYILNALELHLFFARIMKEHSLFLKVGFLPPDAAMGKECELLMHRFETLLGRAISLSDCVVRRCVLESGELFTEFTDCAERQTQRLTGVPIDRRLTARVQALKGSECGEELWLSPTLARQVRQLNRDGMTLVNRLIALKERALHAVTACTMFTGNYPLLIEHILREARLYRSHLMRLEGQSECGCRELRDSELFWDQIMMEHALFMRGLLDPSEEQLIQTADGFAKDYRRLLDAASNVNERVMRSNDTVALTKKFQDFKRAGVEGIEGCEIKSIILPLLADHVLREANHYLRLLGA